MSLCFRVTPRLRAAIAELNAADELRKSKQRTISLASVRRIAAALGNRSSVHELLVAAAPVLPAPAERPSAHPDLKPRLQRLQAAQEGREYAAMVGDICGSEGAASRDASEMSTYRSQAGVGMNLVVSMATMFCVGFYAGGTEAEPYGVRALFSGLGLAILTMLVEITLFVIGASRVDRKVQCGHSDL